MKLKKNWAVSPETDYEIRRLAKRWGISIGRTLERMTHFVGSLDRRTDADERVRQAADLRQAEAKVEMLKRK